MNLTDIPTRFPEPFANSAGPTYTAPVPTLSTGLPAGRASLDLGFPPETFVPVGGGGTPPFGQDFNGLLQQITANERWISAGGCAVYNAAFQTAIGGYPKGAIVQSAVDSAVKWQSSVDANMTNPDASGAGWDLAFRKRLEANLTMYVSTTGNDSNDGLTLATAFATIQGAFNTLVRGYDLRGFNVLVQVSDGTYTTSAQFGTPILGASGAASLTFQGNPVNDSAVILNPASGAAVQIFQGVTCTMQFMQIQSSTSSGFIVNGGGAGLIFNNINFGVCARGHIETGAAAQVVTNGPYRITGGAQYHVSCYAASTMRGQNAVTLTGTPAFSQAFCVSIFGFADLTTSSYTGAATGPRYNASLNGIITTAGLTLPGSSAGTTATGGQYN